MWQKCMPERMSRRSNHACWGAAVTVRAWALEPEYRRIVLRPPAGGVFAVRCLCCVLGLDVGLDLVLGARWHLNCTGLTFGEKLGCVLLLLPMSLLWPVVWPEAGSLELLNPYQP